MTAQLVLDLGYRTALGREDFLVAPCNATAVGWIDRWPAWPAPGLVLAGPAASGKSHLASVWRHLAPDAAALDARTLAGAAGDLLPGRHALVDHADAVAGAAEETLFHLHNLVVERQGHLLLTAAAPPARWTVALPDLASRLRALPVATIAAPDDSLIAAVLVKQFADRQLKVGQDVVRYVLPRIERSFAAVRALVEAVDRAALEAQRPVTIVLVREVLATVS